MRKSSAYRFPTCSCNLQDVTSNYLCETIIEPRGKNKKNNKTIIKEKTLA